MRVRVVVLAALLAVAAPSLQAETYDLVIRAYCPASTNYCGFGNYSSYWNYIRDVVQEINVQWEAAGISFRPAFVSVPLDDPAYNGAQCADADGTPVNEATLFDNWRQDVAAGSPGRISILLVYDTMGLGCCSQLPNNSNQPWYERFGILCDIQRPAYDLGSVLAHELGHHFCLCHTFQMAGASNTPIDLEEWLPGDGALDWDGDDASCPQGSLPPLTTVLDTDPDPRPFEAYDATLPVTAPDENSLFVPRNNHEWCTAQVGLPVDLGSTHATSCTSACSRRLGGQTAGWVPPGTGAERAALAMSYWDDFGRCHGPWTRNGVLFNAFTPGSVTRIQACLDEYRQAGSLNPLVEACGARGGDSDSDGICNLDDNCDFVKNTKQKDGDHDGTGDACDLSFEDPSPQADIDGDLVGAILDQDTDGDGCPNVEDQHPLEAKPVTGSVLYVGCDAGANPVQTFEGKDSDCDGWLNCEDLDDDDDGACDEGGPHPFGDPGVPPGGCATGPGGLDPCPVDAADACHLEIPFPDCLPTYVICNGPGCDPFFLKLVPIGDPDLAPLTIESFQIVNQMLFVSPIAGRTLSRTARALQGDFEALAVPAAAEVAPREQAIVSTLRLEIWSRDPEQLVALVAEYPSDAAVFGDTVRGLFLAITPSGSGLTGAAVFARGQDPLDPPPRDSDGDGWPDSYDNCPDEPNPRQTDADADGFGNVCDPDTDGDFQVTSQDLQWVEGCDGADLTLTTPLNEPAWLGGEARPLPDPTAYALSRRCGAADINDNDVVNADDALLAGGRLGMPPGPSAFRGNTSACAGSGACDDGDPCTADRCVHSTGECLHLPEACDDLDPCTVDTCDPGTGACGHATVACDDGNPCTADFCEPADGSCVSDFGPQDGAACDDLSACTDRDTCLGGACAGTPAVPCDDGDACTLDGCDPGSGACVVAGDACDDGNPCTIDTCGRLGCEHPPLVDGAPCEDGSLCTVGDSCLAVACQPGSAAPCDDGDACTVEGCDPFTGECLFAPFSCDDGDACTADACESGRCINLPPDLDLVAGLRFDSNWQMAWNASPGATHWNTYRGTIPPGGLGSRAQAYDHICFESAGLGADGATVSTDFAVPAVEEAFYYLVSPESACGEGGLGPGPGAVPRPNDRPCRTPP